MSKTRQYNPYAEVTEKQFEAQVKSAAQLRGFEYYHTWRSDHSPSGFPDCFMIHRETYRVIAAELKSEKGKLTELQKYWLDLFEKAGIETYVWFPSDIDEVLAVLEGKIG